MVNGYYFGTDSFDEFSEQLGTFYRELLYRYDGLGAYRYSDTHGSDTLGGYRIM